MNHRDYCARYIKRVESRGQADKTQATTTFKSHGGNCPHVTKDLNSEWFGRQSKAISHPVQCSRYAIYMSKVSPSYMENLHSQVRRRLSVFRENSVHETSRTVTCMAWCCPNVTIEIIPRCVVDAHSIDAMTFQFGQRKIDPQDIVDLNSLNAVRAKSGYRTFGLRDALDPVWCNAVRTQHSQIETGPCDFGDPRLHIAMATQ